MKNIRDEIKDMRKTKHLEVMTDTPEGVLLAERLYAEGWKIERLTPWRVYLCKKDKEGN